MPRVTNIYACAHAGYTQWTNMLMLGVHIADDEVLARMTLETSEATSEVADNCC